MRAHGTRACYVFGVEPGSDRTKGCRCEPCKNANRTYARSRDRASRRPDEIVEPAYIDATDVRAHLRWLARQGVGLRQVAAASGCSRSALQKLRQGQRRRCTPAVAHQVLLVLPLDAADGAYVPAGPTWRLIDDLIARGHTRTALAAALGSTATRPALQLSRVRVTAAHARQVQALHRTLTAGERTAADRSRAWRETEAA